jgi:hypothetical protein
MAMFNIFLLNLLPQIVLNNFFCGKSFSFCERRIFHCKFPFFKEKNAKKGINIFVKFCHTCLQYEKVLKIFFFHILNIANFGSMYAWMVS